MKKYLSKYKKQMIQAELYMTTVSQIFTAAYPDAHEYHMPVSTPEGQVFLIAITFSNHGVRGFVTEPIDFAFYKNWLHTREGACQDEIRYYYKCKIDCDEGDDDTIRSAVKNLVQAAMLIYGENLIGFAAC